MNGTWAYEGALENAREQLAERYPGEVIEIVDTFDIAWSGWEFDYQGALITRDDRPELVVVDATGSDRQTVVEMLSERLREYKRLIVGTEAILRSYWGMLGSADGIDYDLKDAGTGRLWRLRWREGETSDQHAERRRRHAQNPEHRVFDAGEYNLVYESNYDPRAIVHLSTLLAQRWQLDELTAGEIEIIADSNISDEHWNSEHPPTAKVVMTPDTCGGQPRIDGTRLEVSRLLLYMRGGMTEAEISRAWSHLPDGWFDAIIAWLDSHE